MTDIILLWQLTSASAAFPRIFKSVTLLFHITRFYSICYTLKPVFSGHSKRISKLAFNCGHLLGKGCPLGSRLWYLTVSLSLSHWYPGLGQVWYLIVLIPDLCMLTYFQDRLPLNAGQKSCRTLQESILQYFRPSLSYHLSLRPLFCFEWRF